MMITQSGLTVVVPIKKDSIKVLKTYLNKIGDDINHNGEIDFRKFKTVHFMRWFVLEDKLEKTKNRYQTVLIFSSNFDGGLDKHLDELITEAGEAFHRIYNHCENYENPTKERAYIKDFLRKHIKRKKTLYVGVRYHNVERIRKENDLRYAIRDFLDTKKYSKTQTKPSLIYEDIRQFVAENDMTWALEKIPKRSFIQNIAFYGNLFLILVFVPLFALLLLCLFPITLLLLWRLRYLEKHDAPHKERISEARKRGLEEKEDIIVQNQMSLINDVKKGALRYVLLQVFLWVVKNLALYYFNKGKLAGIPSIHFARWVTLNRSKRLLFLSNFDGSWVNYLGDFIDKASIGLTGVWSNTLGFPPTKFLIYRGAKIAERFKNWARFYQIPTQVWYSAYPNISVQNIINNAQIRKFLAKKNPTPREVEAFLARF